MDGGDDAEDVRLVVDGGELEVQQFCYLGYGIFIERQMNV